MTTTPLTSSLLPPSATRLERALGQTMTPTVDPTPLRGLGDSTRITATALPWLAWAASTDAWDQALTEAARRDLVRQSVEIHQRKGTAGAIRRVLGVIGARIELSEWQQGGRTPYTFRLIVWAGTNAADCNAALIDLDLYARIRRMVDAVKNERSHYDMAIGARFDQSLRVAAVLSAVSPITAPMDALPVLPRSLGYPLLVASALSVIPIVRISMELR